MVFTESLIADLRARVKDSKILTAGDDDYATKIKRWSDAAEKPAGAVFLAGSAADISSVIKFTTENSIPIAVLGGGHSTAASSSIGPEGVVIDLSLLRGVKVDTTNKTITAQGGCLWCNIDEEAGKYGLATVGGTVNHTGIGGLTLGGGYGWLTGQYGSVVDNLLSVTVVLADGSIVTASEAQHADLFWALRGAGQNFGVAVEFVFRAYEHPGTVWAGLLAFPPPQLPAVVEFANRLDASNKGEKGMIFGFSAPPPAGQPCMIAGVFHDGPEDEAQQAFKGLLDLQPVLNTTGSIPYSALNGMLNPTTPHGTRKSMGSASFSMPLDPAVVQGLFDEFSAQLSKYPEMARSAVLLEIMYRKKLQEVPVDATAFANRGNAYNAVFLTWWSDEKLDGEMRAYGRKMAAKMQNEAGSGNAEKLGLYSNYASPGQPVKAMFGSNIERLEELKAKYDPKNIFNKWHNIIPKSN